MSKWGLAEFNTFCRQENVVRITPKKKTPIWLGKAMVLKMFLLPHILQLVNRDVSGMNYTKYTAVWFHVFNVSLTYLSALQVVDSSDVVIQVLDARDPMGTRCRHVERYLAREKPHKHLIFILNKVDLVPTWLTVCMKLVAQPVVVSQQSPFFRNLGWSPCQKKDLLWRFMLR